MVATPRGTEYQRLVQWWRPCGDLDKYTMETLCVQCCDGRSKHAAAWSKACKTQDVGVSKNQGALIYTPSSAYSKDKHPPFYRNSHALLPC